MHHLDGHYAELCRLTGRKNVLRYRRRRPFPGRDILVRCHSRLPISNASQTNVYKASPCGIDVMNVD